MKGKGGDVADDTRRTESFHIAHLLLCILCVWLRDGGGLEGLYICVTRRGGESGE